MRSFEVLIKFEYWCTVGLGFLPAPFGFSQAWIMFQNDIQHWMESSFIHGYWGVVLWADSMSTHKMLETWGNFEPCSSQVVEQSIRMINCEEFCCIVQAWILMYSGATCFFPAPFEYSHAWIMVLEWYSILDGKLIHTRILMCSALGWFYVNTQNVRNFG